MENITLKEHEIKNNYFPHLVVEFEIENFGISRFDKEDQKGSHAHAYTYNKLPNQFSDFKCFNRKLFFHF